MINKMTMQREESSGISMLYLEL